MKRMYVVLGIIVLLFVWAAATLGQRISVTKIDDPHSEFEKRLKLRDELHRRMLDKVLNGIGPDDDMLFRDLDQMFEDSLSKSFGQIGSYSQSRSEAFGSQWEETKDGRRLILTPKDKKQPLDINIQNGMITVKGEQETKSQYGVSRSQFSYSINVPEDCDESKVKMGQDGDKILVDFPYRSVKAINKEPEEKSRRPLPKQDGEIEI